MFLESHDIQCQMRNQHASSLMGEIPFFSVWPELWAEDHDVAAARALIKEFEQREPPMGDEWQCIACKETNEPQFELCWNCLTANPEVQQD